jgi:membrane-associated protease RseP (regulator of RpoE activity)
LVEQSPIGEKQQITIIRGRRPISLRVALEEQPTETPAEDGKATHGVKPAAMKSYPDFGIHAAPLPEILAKKLFAHGIQGVLVTAVGRGSPAQEAGLKPGMILGQIGQFPVTNMDSFHDAVQGMAFAESLLLLAHTPDGSLFLVARGR